MGGSPKKLSKHFFFTNSLCKTLIRFCFVRIKEGVFVAIYFWPYKKSRKEKIKKKERKSKNTRGYTWRKPRRLPKVSDEGPKYSVEMLKDQNVQGW